VHTGIGFTNTVKERNMIQFGYIITTPQVSLGLLIIVEASFVKFWLTKNYSFVSVLNIHSSLEMVSLQFLMLG